MVGLIAVGNEMFTGLITEIGSVTALRHGAHGLRWAIAAPESAPQLRVGDSINVAGVCQTVESIAGERLYGTAIRQTLDVTTFSHWRPGQRVNLELALRADGRLGGHLVSGHIDGIGRVHAIRRNAEGHRLTIAIPRRFDHWAVPKGSVALDGVSLTVAEKTPGMITVALIPETLAQTTLGALHHGDSVNVEFDQLVKAVAPVRGASGVDADMLTRAGW